MTRDERNQKLEAYGCAYHTLLNALSQFPPEAWDFRPAPGEWSIHEVIVHLADSEINSGARIRQCIADPGNPILGYKQAAWASEMHYQEQSTADALELFKVLRRSTYQLLKAVPESAWANTVVHPERGVQTLDDLLTIFERHVRNHIEQMQNNYRAWLAQPK
jgi:uncharacterized damage-inducible protein DinB